MPENPTNPGMELLRRYIIPILTSAILGFIGGWWNGQITQVQVQSRLDRLEERQREAAAATAEASRTAQGNAIRMAEISIIQNNVVEQLREIRKDHEQFQRK